MPKVTLIITVVYSLMKELLNSEIISSLHQSTVFLSILPLQRSAMLEHIWNQNDIWPTPLCRAFILQWASMLESKVFNWKVPKHHLCGKWYTIVFPLIGCIAQANDNSNTLWSQGWSQTVICRTNYSSSTTDSKDECSFWKNKVNVEVELAF